MKIYLSFFLIFFIVCVAYSSDPFIVTIPSLGQVSGAKLASPGRDILAFRGIPYAQPPVGDLRFKDPVPVKPWHGNVLDAKKEGPTCPQYESMFDIVRGEEDCLQLNVYTRDLSLNESLKPTMVWIHGGAWYMGSGNGEMYGPEIFFDHAHDDVIFVTINYRIGALGFLSTEDSEAPGNYGLLDQSLALKWVRDNIRYFGGNPDAVTIFGESAGGASVQYQILTPYSKGLFHRAITQSGSSMCPWALLDTVGEYTQMLAEHLNCPLSSKDMLNCLRTKKVQEIEGFRKKIQTVGMHPIAFGPRIDVERESPFLPAHPKELIEQKRFNSVPIITGMTKNEGAFFVASLLAKGGKELNEFQENPLKSIRYALGVELHPKGDEIARRVGNRYFDQNKKYQEQLDQLEQMYSDDAFFKCISDSTSLLSKFGDHPVYYYLYAHRGQFSIVDMLMGPSSSKIDLGVSHADELMLMFSMKFLPPLSRESDIKVSNIMLDLWTSFAREGIPRSELIQGDWLPLDLETLRYLKIDAGQTEMVEQAMPFSDRMLFWDSARHTAGKDEL